MSRATDPRYRTRDWPPKQAWDAGGNEVPVRYVAVCQKTGTHLREATEEERAAYDRQPLQAPFDRPVTVGAVLVEAYTGPGIHYDYNF